MLCYKKYLNFAATRLANNGGEINLKCNVCSHLVNAARHIRGVRSPWAVGAGEHRGGVYGGGRGDWNIYFHRSYRLDT